MSKHSFKVGDKVKLKDPNKWSMGDVTGIIIKVTTPYIRVDWEGKETWKVCYPHLPEEIEHILKKGEQLIFNFMML